MAVGEQVPAPNRGNFSSVEQCLAVCDNAGGECVGITVTSNVNPAEIPKSCSLIKANTEPGTFKRTVIRANLGKLNFPSAFLW